LEVIVSKEVLSRNEPKNGITADELTFVKLFGVEKR
jgi:hypothetical protein